MQTGKTDQTPDAKADLSLRWEWVHMPFCRFCLGLKYFWNWQMKSEGCDPHWSP